LPKQWGIKNGPLGRQLGEKGGYTVGKGKKKKIRPKLARLDPEKGRKKECLSNIKPGLGEKKGGKTLPQVIHRPCVLGGRVATASSAKARSGEKPHVNGNILFRF